MCCIKITWTIFALYHYPESLVSTHFGVIWNFISVLYYSCRGDFHVTYSSYGVQSGCGITAGVFSLLGDACTTLLTASCAAKMQEDCVYSAMLWSKFLVTVLQAFVKYEPDYMFDRMHFATLFQFQLN